MQENNEINQEDNKQEQQEEMVSKAEYNQLKADFNDMKELKKRLFDELHDMKNKDKERQELEDHEKKERMTKEGRYEDLYKDAMEKLQQERDARDNEKKAAEGEKLDRVAQQLAVEAGVDNKNLRFVTREIRDRLVMNEGQVGVLDQSGKLTISSTKDLVNEIHSSEDYSHMIIDNKASGGGAIGSMSGAQQKNFNELTESERVKLYKESPLKYNQAKLAANEQD